MQEKEYKKCFACGIDNPIGLKLEFKYENQKAIAIFKLNENYEGYPGIIHGGIVSTILDESMAKIILLTNNKAVTIEMNTKFKQIMQSNTTYTAQAWITKNSSRTIKTTAEIINDENKIIAQAEAVFFKIKEK